MTAEIFYIGMDLGGTTFKAIAVSTGGQILARVQDNTRVEDEPELVAQSMVQAIRYLQHQLASRGHLRAVGFGVPGILDLPHGMIRRSPNLPRWRNVDLRAILNQYLDVPFTIENDANAAVLGEMWQGAGRGMTHMMMLTLGTGVGGGVIIDGTILQGAHGFAGELGHTIVDPNGPLCGCGSYGCLEQFVSGTAIARMAVPYYGEVTAKALAASARLGDARAVIIYKQVGHYLGIAGANFANLLNPECMVIGGAVAQAFDLFIGTMRETMRKRCFDEVYDSLSIVPAACGTDAGGLGAAYQAMQWVST